MTLLTPPSSPIHHGAIGPPISYLSPTGEARSSLTFPSLKQTHISPGNQVGQLQMRGVPAPDFERDTPGKVQHLLLRAPPLGSRLFPCLHIFHSLHIALQAEPALNHEQRAGQVEKISSFRKGQRDSSSTNGLQRCAL